MSIAYFSYALQPKSPFLSIRKGALIRIHFPSLGMGYADCHPWPELGDAPLEVQLKHLAWGDFTPLTAGTWQNARREAEARARGEPLLGYKKNIKSHFLITDLSLLTAEHLNQLAEEGYSHLKIKLGRCVEKEIKQLLSFFSSSFSFKLRFDFNERLNFSSFCLFLKQIACLHPKVDFIEDPFPWHPQEWPLVQREGWTLACDRQAEKAMHQTEAAQVLILKPAIQANFSSFVSSSQRLIITSYAGHPIEQIAAAAIAAEIDSLGESVHGLLTHHAYFPNVFSQKLDWRKPYLVPLSGIGNGFDQELEQLEWKMLL